MHGIRLIVQTIRPVTHVIRSIVELIDRFTHPICPVADAVGRDDRRSPDRLHRFHRPCLWAQGESICGSG